jgi:hypothetical protein
VAEQTLGQLTVSWLTKFIRQQFEQNPITHISTSSRSRS